MQVAKWGNSLVVRLPAALVEELELCESDDIEITEHDKRIFTVHKKMAPEAVWTQLRTFRGKLPTDFRFSRDDANV